MRTTRPFDHGLGRRSASSGRKTIRELSLSESWIAFTVGSLNGARSRLQNLDKLAGSTKSFAVRSSVTNIYISSRDTGLTPTLTLWPIHIAPGRCPRAAAGRRATRTDRCIAGGGVRENRRTRLRTQSVGADDEIIFCLGTVDEMDPNPVGRVLELAEGRPEAHLRLRGPRRLRRESRPEQGA